MASTTISYSSSGYNGLMDWLGKGKSDGGSWQHPETSRGYVSSYSFTEFSGSYSSDKVFSQSSSTVWHQATSDTARRYTEELRFDFGDGRIMPTHFAMQARNSPDDLPQGFALQASEDGGVWETLLEVSGFSSAGGGQWGDWEIESSTAFRFFRIIIDPDELSQSSHDYYSVGEVEFYGTYEDGFPTSIPSDAYVPFAVPGFNGLVDWLGRSGDLDAAYSNVDGIIDLSESSYVSAGRDAGAATDETFGDFSSTNTAGSWWKMDVGSGNAWIINKVALCGSEGNRPRNWKLQASNDDSSWVDLYEAVDDGPASWGDWFEIEVTDDTPYRYWRVLNTGVDSGGANYLQIAGIEFYGYTDESVLPVPDPEVTTPAEQYWPPDGEYRFTVELGIAAEGSGTYVWGTDVWGTALWSGYEPDYLDVTEYVQEFVCKSGRDKFDERMRTGTARVIFDNTDGWFNPDNGEDLDATVNLRPGRWLRLSAVRVTDDATWTIWEGFIHSLTESYGNGGSNSTTVVDAYDFAALMAQHNEPAQSAAGSGELTGDRINRVLDEFSPVDGGWPWRDVAAGAHTMQSTTLAQNLLEEAQRASDADNGAFWFRGKIATFRGFNWLSTEPRSVSPTLYPGRGEVGDPEIMDVQTEWTAQVIKNDVQMSASGGSAQRSQDTTSIGMYGRRSWQRLDLENDTDADVSDIADQILAAYAYDYQRVKQITIVPDANVTVGEMLAMQLGDLIYVTVNLGLRDWKYTVEAHVTGIEFRVRPADWDMVLRLDQSARGNPEA